MIISDVAVKEEAEKVLAKFGVDVEKFWSCIEGFASGDSCNVMALQKLTGANKPAVIQTMNILCEKGYVKKSWTVGCGFCGEVILSANDIDEIKDGTRMCPACGSPNNIFSGSAQVNYTF